MSSKSGTSAERVIRCFGQSARGPRGAAIAFMAGLGIGCGAADELPADETESVQAVLSIERVEYASQEETPSANAMAQFVVLPTEADAHATLDAAGLRAQLPERAGCVEAFHADPNGRSSGSAPETSASSSASASASGTGTWSRVLPFPEPLELLEAGDVSIDAEGIVTVLALNVFPPSGSASGVIYTTPDQSAQPLPPDTLYAIRATGSEGIPPLTIQGRAPGTLRDVTLAGLPLGGVVSLSSARPLDLTWSEGDPADRIYVELTDSEKSIVCGFDDDGGAGTVPAAYTAKLAPESVVRLSVHRVREALQSRGTQPLDGMSAEATALEAMVRFDFELISLLRVE